MYSFKKRAVNIKKVENHWSKVWKCNAKFLIRSICKRWRNRLLDCLRSELFFHNPYVQYKHTMIYRWIQIEHFKCSGLLNDGFTQHLLYSRVIYKFFFLISISSKNVNAIKIFFQWITVCFAVIHMTILICKLYWP